MTAARPARTTMSHSMAQSFVIVEMVEAGESSSYRLVRWTVIA